MALVWFVTVMRILNHQLSTCVRFYLSTLQCAFFSFLYHINQNLERTHKQRNKTKRRIHNKKKQQMHRNKMSIKNGKYLSTISVGISFSLFTACWRANSKSWEKSVAVSQTKKHQKWFTTKIFILIILTRILYIRCSCLHLFHIFLILIFLFAWVFLSTPFPFWNFFLICVCFSDGCCDYVSFVLPMIKWILLDMFEKEK